MKRAKFIFQIIVSIAFFLVCILPVFSQTNVQSKYAAYNFFEVQKELNQYYKENPDQPDQKHWERTQWFLEPRLYPSGKRINITKKTLKAYQHYKTEHGPQRNVHGNWSFLGPYYCSVGMGRVNALAFHPTNENIIYIAASSGGVWKTTNGANTWQNITPDIPLLAIADVALDPSNPNIIYALTGDGNPKVGELEPNPGSEISSIGIIKSFNGGATWYPTLLNLEHPSDIIPTKLLVHPTNGQIQYLVGNHGILSTTNGWVDIDTAEFLTTPIYDIEFKPNNPTIMYACSNRYFYRSDNSGTTWQITYDAALDTFENATRIELAVSPSQPNIVFALAGNGKKFLALCKSNFEGQALTWELKPTPIPPNMGGQMSYNIALAVDPTNSSNIFGAGVRCFNSSNQGEDWSEIGSGVVHGDYHDLKFAHGKLWAATDGGVYSSDNLGGTWQVHNTGLAITEIYKISGTPQNTNLYFTGSQDNGTMKRNGNTSTFEFVKGGDGMVNYIDPLNSNIVYASAQKGVFYKSTTGGGSGSYTNLNIPGDEGAWVTPMVAHPTVASRIFVGKDSMYWYDVNIGWNYIGEPTGSNLYAIGISKQATSRLYVSSSSNLRRADNIYQSAPVIWQDIDNNLPNLYITDIAVDPNASGRVFVCFSGYSNMDKVYMSEDAGVNWINISGSLPPIPANCLKFHDNGLDNDALYLGTDMGVFYRDNDIGDWIYFSNNMPSVTVSDLYINETNNTIAAGTFGRGLWRADLFSECSGSIVLTNQTGSPIGGTQHHSVSTTIFSNRDYKADLESNVHYKAGVNIILTNGFRAGGHGFFEAKLGPCPGN